MKHAAFTFVLLSALSFLAPLTPVQAQARSKPAPSGAQPAASAATGEQALFAQRCPTRVHTLLSAAVPGYKPPAETIQAICDCALAKLDTTNGLSAGDTVPKRASMAVLNCARPTVTSYNQDAITTRFGPYLTTQPGWKPEDVSSFAACFAEQHWKETFEAGLLDRQATGSDLNALWQQCTNEVGHPGTPLPGPAVSKAPVRP